MRLVQFVSRSGVCSRRNASVLIKNGEVFVNNLVCIDPAYVTQETDVVTYQNNVLTTHQELLYLMLNKPKGVICASSSPHEETTVIDLVKKEFEDDRLYPIGRLDKDSTGLILITNDGDLAHKLSHPKFEIQKKYLVKLSRSLDQFDEEDLLAGIMLEDGLSKFDAITFPTNSQRTMIVTLHSGKNRIIRRMFAHFAYEVVNLHRISVDFLELGNLTEGQWRKLTEDEITKLKNN
jgi:23S rRNA pseudouridine2605 synthase